MDEKSKTGLSPRINDKAFARFRKGNAGFVCLILAAAGYFALLFYSLFVAKVPANEGVALFFVVFAVIIALPAYRMIRSRKLGQDWEGEIIDKRIWEARQRVDKKDPDKTRSVLVYEVYARREDGGVEKLRQEDDSSSYDYYHVGDRVHCHGNLHFLEKFDKSGDAFSLCAGCKRVNALEEEHCRFCGCPLLK